MKKQKRRIILFLIILVIIVIFFKQKQEFLHSKFQDELIFFKLFSFAKTEEKETIEPSYHFQVSYNNINFKDISLLNSVREKIAPGTKGEFEIFLQSNKKMNYRIQFKSTNEKPENLYFQIKGKDKKYKKIEDMETDLKGEIEGNKRIIIQWKWDYEKSKIENIQDTKDGKKIKQYHFIIYAIGE